MDLFISYASEDRETARAVAAALQQRGWSVWWDRHIRTGRSFDVEIERELNEAHGVIVLWSAASIASEWVRSEAAEAAERGVLIPAAIEPVKFPLEFRRRQTADLVGWSGRPDHEGFAALCADIATLPGLGGASASGAERKPKHEAVRRWRWQRPAAVASIGLAAAVSIAALHDPDRAHAEPSEARAAVQPGTAPASAAISQPAVARSTSGAPVQLLSGGPSQLLVGRADPPPMAEAPRAAGSLQAGSLDFRWPGGDCWRIYRGEQQAGSHCGAAKLALQTGRYQVRAMNAVFEPVEVEIRPNQATVVAVDAGRFEFKWPGRDCWQVLRADERVASNCGAGKQTLQAGRYTLKAASGSVFQPMQIVLKANQVTTIDAAAGLFDFNWPGSDCWAIHRGEERVASGCGRASQALQQGRYVVKASSNAFEPFEIRIAGGERLSAP